jgi:hypothetical protein
MAGLKIYACFLTLSLMSAEPGFGDVIFHNGSTDSCQGCHTTPPLLTGSDPSSTCLRCHAVLGVPQNIKSSDGSSFTPGGDYYWLGKTFAWTDGFNVTTTSPGNSHGHSIIALDYGLSADPELKMAPGGSYPSDSLTCISCHDPHAATGSSYRLLGGAGYQAGMTSGFSFLNPAPLAVAPSNWTETDSNHVSYGRGFSEWCANCHGAFLSCVIGINAIHHPACSTAFLGWDIANNYNSYISSGNLTGSVSVAYRALVPFESGNNMPLNPSSTAGPDANANVMCLSCHRAHASAFRSIARWDFQATEFKYSHPSGAGDGSTYSDKLNSYYGRTFQDFQRQLCSKCHIRD